MRPAAAAIAACLAVAAQVQTGYQTYSTGVSPNGIVAADLNGDGKPDLVIANAGSQSLTILLNNGNGFTPLAPGSLTSTFAASVIAAADLNGDGKIDLVVGGAGSSSLEPAASGGIVALLGNGDGTFQTPRPVAGASGPTSLQIADLNGDGIPDLAFTYLTLGFLAPTGAGLAILSGNGDGTFGTASGGTANGGFLNLTPWAALTIGDFNHDGKPDIAAVTGGLLTVFLNDGKANFTTFNTNGGSWNFAPGIATGDFNSDGILDLVITGQSSQQDGSPQGTVTILLGKGDGTFQVQPAIPTNTVAQSVAVADLNRDGHADVVIGSNPPAFLPGRGDGTFADGIPISGSGNSGYFALADFEGTGMPGLAAGNLLWMGPVPIAGNVAILPQVLWPSLSFMNVSAADFGMGPLAPGSVVTALGLGLAQQTAAASNGAPPIALGGDSVTVTGADGKALPAEIYYVSPGQVNYVVPASSPQGFGTVSIAANGVVVAKSQIDIEPVAPRLFVVNADNLPAAYITRVSQSGQQTYQAVYQAGQAVYQTGPSGSIVPVPIDLSSATDTFYLSIYGTGIRNVRAPIAVTASIGTVTYAGPEGIYDGLDQVNILLPSGPGSPLVAPTPFNATLQLNVGGQSSNPVTLTMQ